MDNRNFTTVSCLAKMFAGITKRFLFSVDRLSRPVLPSTDSYVSSNSIETSARPRQRRMAIVVAVVAFPEREQLRVPGAAPIGDKRAVSVCWHSGSPTWHACHIDSECCIG
jgi:hypothetical protein